MILTKIFVPLRNWIFSVEWRETKEQYKFSWISSIPVSSSTFGWAIPLMHIKLNWKTMDLNFSLLKLKMLLEVIENVYCWTNFGKFRFKFNSWKQFDASSTSEKWRDEAFCSKAGKYVLEEHSCCKNKTHNSIVGVV